MIWGKTFSEKNRIRVLKTATLEEYKDWFAWRPVRLQDERWVWLEPIERRYHKPVLNWHAQYRLKETEK